MVNGIDRIRVAGLKSIDKLDLTLSPLNVLIGPNGAGKSNFLLLFRLLNALTEGRLQNFVGMRGGASVLLHYGVKRTPALSLELCFHSDTGANRYSVTLVAVAPDTLIFSEERIEWLPAGGAPKQFVFEGGGRETQLAEVIDVSTPTSKSKTAQTIKYRLDRFRSYHFHDTSESAGVKKLCDLNDNRFLRADASNLAAFLFMLKSAHYANYSRIRETVRLAVPRFDDFAIEPSRLNPSGLLLAWREKDSDYEFTGNELSDGSLRFICLATLLLQPFEHPNAPLTITIDEPELGLHPQAITLLADLLRSASQDVQIIVSTQSASLVSSLDQPESVVVVDREKERSVFRRLEPDKLAHWLEDYTVGDLWERASLAGCRPHEPAHRPVRGANGGARGAGIDRSPS